VVRRFLSAYRALSNTVTSAQSQEVSNMVVDPFTLGALVSALIARFGEGAGEKTVGDVRGRFEVPAGGQISPHPSG